VRCQVRDVAAAVGDAVAVVHPHHPRPRG
jgi:hypothetical protein